MAKGKPKECKHSYDVVRATKKFEYVQCKLCGFRTYNRIRDDCVEPIEGGWLGGGSFWNERGFKTFTR